MTSAEREGLAVTRTTAEALADSLRARVAASGDRVMIGICGAPGAGKSTLAERLGDLLGPEVAAVVPFDGFHLALAVIRGTPLLDRRGALDTFDVGSYRALMERLRARDEAVVYAPAFRRGLEEPIASAIAVPRAVPIVITEGNYLLTDQPDLMRVRDLLDEVWYLDLPDAVRLPRLIARHVEFGRAPDDAEAWATGTDQANADRIEATRDRADRIIQLGAPKEPS